MVFKFTVVYFILVIRAILLYLVIAAYFFFNVHPVLKYMYSEND